MRRKNVKSKKEETVVDMNVLNDMADEIIETISDENLSLASVSGSCSETILDNDETLSLVDEKHVETVIVPSKDVKPQKCLILCMCCNDELYQKEFQDIMGTWGRLANSDAYPNIEVWGYTASEKGTYDIDHEKHMLYVPVMDTLNATFDKTVKALRMLDMLGLEYDWILRTNCSTTINLAMLSSLMADEGVLDKEKVYVQRLYMSDTKVLPKSTSVVFFGNFILMSRKYTALINDESVEIAKKVHYESLGEKRYLNPHLFHYDDITIASIFNTYLWLNDRNPADTYVVLTTQYMEDIYGLNEPLLLSSVAFFNKNVAYSEKNIRHYFYDMEDRYMDFYGKYYPMLNGSIDELEDSMSERQMVHSVRRAADGSTVVSTMSLEEYGSLYAEGRV